MPWWMTPLLCEVWCARCGSRARARAPAARAGRALAPSPAPRSLRRRPRRRRSRVEQVERGADDGLRVDLVVLVEVGEVPGLAEVLHAQAGDRRTGRARQERERVRMA